ncbi:SSI family serine proteinase inhibitor [Paractinoplanes lichenicola]|uniref:Serine protease n=1 Tax=Paractinoplanes lichenicola TaxID=2802976 RepID=A0ABS1VS28_9ACTN|nr:SSI family serine proteinase inhibitor [Actinoplanes lichenicola]MBL7256557.1 serine protease [Actinoplanes lichenicola]
MLPVALAAVAVTAVLGPLPDPKPTYGGPPRPGAQQELTLSYVADAGFAMAVKLTCDPPGGGHPLPAQACATLAATGADPDRIKPGTGACILLYKPVTATLSGTWQGREVSWQHRFGNTCEMRRATGVLFRF